MGSRVFLGHGNFGVPRYESKYKSSQHFPMGGYESVNLRELHQLLQFKNHYKHGAQAFRVLPLGIFGGPERTESLYFERGKWPFMFFPLGFFVPIGCLWA